MTYDEMLNIEEEVMPLRNKLREVEEKLAIMPNDSYAARLWHSTVLLKLRCETLQESLQKQFDLV